jgi:hypothetical protein
MRGRIPAWPFFVGSPGWLSFQEISAMAELDDTIRENAQGPAKASGDTGSVEQHKLPDQIAADRYLASKDAAKSKSRGLVLNKFVPPGTS